MPRSTQRDSLKVLVGPRVTEFSRWGCKEEGKEREREREKKEKKKNFDKKINNVESHMTLCMAFYSQIIIQN